MFSGVKICCCWLFFRAAYPKSTHAEVIAFLWNAWGWYQQPQQLYWPAQIVAAENRLGMSRKKGSTTAFQARCPVNIALQSAFWLMLYPYGIADVPADTMIDIDEAGVSLETANRGYGKAHIATRVRQVGLYGHSNKFTILLAISG